MNRVRLVCVCGAESAHNCTADWRVPNVADAAWHSVWLHGDWRALTQLMTSAERSHAADAVARQSRQLAVLDGDLTHTEPQGLRWWLDAAA